MAAAKEHVLEATNELKQAAAIELFTGVILASPVDTGRFRANWNFSTGRPDLTMTEQADPSGRQAIHAATNGVIASTLESRLYLSNNLPYAIPLEMGYSKQAPEGMVRKNLARVKANLARGN